MAGVRIIKTDNSTLSVTAKMCKSAKKNKKAEASNIFKI
jgi:hypothetical protein